MAKEHNTVGPPHLQVLHPQIQPTMDLKYLEKKIPEISKT